MAFVVALVTLISITMTKVVLMFINMVGGPGVGSLMISTSITMTRVVLMFDTMLSGEEGADISVIVTSVVNKSLNGTSVLVVWSAVSITENTVMGGRSGIVILAVSGSVKTVLKAGMAVIEGGRVEAVGFVGVIITAAQVARKSIIKAIGVVFVGLSTVRRSIISAVAETIVSVRGCGCGSGSGSEISTLASPRIVTVAITVGALAIVAVALVVMDVAVAIRTEGVVEAVPKIRLAMALVAKEGRLTTLCERGSCGSRWTMGMEVVWAGWALSGRYGTRRTTV